MAEDLTGQSCSAEALGEMRERYALATASGGVGVWDCNFATDELYLDPGLYTMLGFAAAASAAELWPGRHPDDRERAGDAAGRLGPELECRVLHQAGGTRWLLVRGRVLRRALRRNA